MNTQRQQAKELLELEIKLARLKIAASYLKQRRSAEQQVKVAQMPLFTLLDIGSDLARNQILHKTAALPLQRKYRFGALLALFAWQAVQSYYEKNHSDI